MFFTIFTPPVIIETGGNMNKSIAGFVLGLVFSLLGAIASYILWVVTVLVAAFSFGNAPGILAYLPLINISTYVISLVGCCFCFAKPKVGGIIMLVAGLLSTICLTTVFILLKAFDVMFILFVIPTFMILLAAILSLIKAKKAKSRQLISHVENQQQS